MPRAHSTLNSMVSDEESYDGEPKSPPFVGLSAEDSIVGCNNVNGKFSSSIDYEVKLFDDVGQNADSSHVV